MAKFIIGVLVGLFLGASTTTYGAGASRQQLTAATTAKKFALGRDASEACGGSNGTYSWRANLSR
jgi:hypothetical protein